MGLQVVLIFNLKHLLRQALVYRFYEVAIRLLFLQDVLAVSIKLSQVSRTELLVVLR